VFVSYDLSVRAHVEAVKELVRRLRADGVVVRTPTDLHNAVFITYESEFADTDIFLLARSEHAEKSPLGMVVLPTGLPGLPPTLEVVFPELRSVDEDASEHPLVRIPEEYDKLLARIRGTQQPEPVAPDPAALEELAQAIALGDKFQLLALQCIDMDTGDLLRALDAVSSRVYTLCQVPPLPVVYDPYLSAAEQGSARGEAWVREVLGPLSDLESPGHDEASLVAVVNGLAYDPRNPADVDAWRVLLQQMNERRNALARTFRGTLLLAFGTPLIKLLFEVAPDLASIRSGSIRLHPSVVPKPKPVPELGGWYDRSLIQEAELRRLAQDPEATRQRGEQARHTLQALAGLKMPFELQAAEDPTPIQASDLLTRTLGAATSKSLSDGDTPKTDSVKLRRDQLAGLLAQLLTNADMYHFAQRLWRGAAFELPQRASGHQLADAIILSAERQGRVDNYFFELLAQDFPGRAGAIWAAAAAWGVAPKDRKKRGSLSHDAVHAALLRLTREQLEQVVRLVWGRVPWMYGKRKLSARELLRHATQLGSDGLSQLQDAIDVVTR